VIPQGLQGNLFRQH